VTLPLLPVEKPDGSLDADAARPGNLISPDPLDGALSHLVMLTAESARTVATAGATLGMASRVANDLSRENEAMGWLLQQMDEGNDAPRPSRAALDREHGLPGGFAPLERRSPAPLPKDVGDFLLASESGDLVVAACDLLLRSTCDLAWAAYDLAWPPASEQVDAFVNAWGVAHGSAAFLIEELSREGKSQRFRGDCTKLSEGRRRPRGREEADPWRR
jgi:hypothetical protein